MLRISKYARQSSALLRQNARRFSAPPALSANTRGPNRPALNVQVGDKLHGFTVEAIDPCTDYNITAVRMVHEATGCGYVHVDSSDTNNVFGIAVRTPPPNSSGVPHILEHCVLCGSEAFPVRDPFFKMLKRSMNNFMNAMTYHDYTVYPFATQNVQDFDNLMRVYLDLVLFPNLRHNDFLQEGHRLDFEDDKLVRSGVVFNEMKGTLSDASTVFGYKLQESLFPNTSFAHNSGGYPSEIPSLTYEQLKEFHKVHYHPSNALLYTYGDIPLEHHASQMESLVMQRFSRNEDAAQVLNLQQKMIADVGVEFYGNTSEGAVVSERAGEMKVVYGPVDPVREIEEQAKFAMSFRVNVDARNTYDLVVLSVLDSLLSTGVTSPIYQSLIQTQLAPGYCPGAGLSCTAQYPTLTFGVDGVSESSIELIEKAVNEALESAAETGFNQLRVKAILHQFEAQLRSRKTHFGLEILGGYCRRWMQDGLVHEVVQNPSEIISKLEEEMEADPQFWQKLIRRHLIENRYQRLVMLPDSEFAAKAEASEQKELQTLQEAMGEEEEKRIREMSITLANEREQEQDLSCLPTLKIADVPRVSPNHTVVQRMSPNILGSDQKLDLWWPTDVDMNGIVSLSIDFDTSRVPSHLQTLVPLACTLLGEVSTAKRHFHDLALERDVYVNAMSMSPFTSPWLGQESASTLPVNHSTDGAGMPFRKGVRVFLGCLDRFLPQALDITNEVLTESEFAGDREHLRGLLKMVAMNASSSLNQDAGGFSRLLAALTYGGDGAANREYQEGVTSVMLAQRLADLDDAGIDQVAAALDSVVRAIFVRDRMSMFVSCGNGTDLQEDGSSTHDVVQGSLAGFASRLPERMTSLDSVTLPVERDDRHLRNQRDASYYVGLPIPVHYCTAYVPTGATFRTPEDYVDMSVLSELVALSLHRDIREKGGAYGAFCNNTVEGNLVFQSYYDPNTDETLRAFANGIDSVVKGRFTEEQVTESILSILSKSDAPRLPQRLGFESFSEGLQAEQRQRVRDRFFALRKDDVQSLAQKSFGSTIDPELFLRGRDSTSSEYSPPSVCIFGSLESGRELFSNRNGWKFEDLTANVEV